MELIHVQSAAGDTLTNSTAETVLGSVAFPANFWSPGKVVKARALVTIPSTNSTNTLQTRVRFGAAALTGAAIGTTSDLDVADDDLVVADVELVCRSVGSAGVIVATVLVSEDAAGTAAGAHGSVVSSVDTTAATYLGVTGEWSAANASNQCAVQAMTAFEAAAK
jgi:hypothetical protein